MAGTKTYMAKPGEVKKNWWLVDADGKILGRLASDIAVILMCKHRTTYTPPIDTGDFVIVTNVAKIVLTCNYWALKKYSWYPGYMGLRSETAERRRSQRPELVLREAVRRMLPKNKLAAKMLSKLKIYVGTDHEHQAQQPQAIELGVKKS